MRRQRAKGKRQKKERRPAHHYELRVHAPALLTFAFCLFTFAFFSASAQKETEDSPAQTAAFHRWGAVTMFHGLPSDRVRAIAQDAEGLMWFGTDAGLARYDGRRTQTVADEGLASRRVLALRMDAEGTLWVGTDDGAFLRTPAGEFRLIAETKGKQVTAIIAPAAGRVLLATVDGLILDCRKKDDGSQAAERSQQDSAYAVEQVGERILPAQSGAGAGKQLELTGLALAGETVLVGTRGRGLLAIERGAVREIAWRPRAFFVEALEQEGARVYLGAQAPASDSGLFSVEADAAKAGDSSQMRPAKVTGEATGTVTTMRADGRGGLYVGTDGRGVFRLRADGRRVERFTFAGTAGALRSDRVHSVFIDREGVAWFGTDRGVCRYDPRGLRVENVAEERDANFVRALYRASSGALYCGTNRGLYARETPSSAWRFVEALGRRTVYAISEDRRGRILVGTVAGLYASLPPGKSSAATVRFVPERSAEEKKEEETVKLAEDSKPAGESDDAAPPDQETAKAEGSAVGATAGEKTEPEKIEPSVPTAAPVVAGNVRSVARFGGSVYIATFGRGVERLDDEFRRTTVWPRGGGEDEARLREVVSLHVDERAGRLWIGTAGAGVFHFDGESVKTEPALDALSRAAVRGMSAGADGWLWLATSHGLYAYAPGGRLLEVAPGVDARAVVAPATMDGEQRPSQTSTPQAWFATAVGVVKVTLDEQFGHVAATLDAEQGLPSENAFALLALDAEAGGVGETLLIGTSRGLAAYEPGRVAPVLRPTRLTASRPLPLEELQRDGGLQLAYPQNGLVLDVAATSSRTFPEQFQYAFLLQDAAGRVIKRKLSHDSLFQVENLKPGRYRVTARAFSIDLYPSAPFAFDLVVTKAPFPWTTAALSTLLALALVALVWGYVQHRKIVRSRGELFEANRQLAAARLQLANEAESERRRIARDLHDQTLADLRRLMLLADEMQPAEPALAGNGSHRTTDATPSAALDPSILRAEIESVSQEIRRICEDLSPSVLENVGFAAALEWALAERVAHMPPDRKFTYEFTCDEQLEERLHFAPGVQMQVYRIVQEAVSNVCRHAEATHVRLSASVDEADDAFTLTLEDDGRGLPHENRKARRGRGLANIRARASLIEAEVEWHRREGGGTAFVLKKVT